MINSTLGECQDDDGKLMVLLTVEKMLRSMPVEEMCSYAPIGGIPGFNEAVQISLFGHVVSVFMWNLFRLRADAERCAMQSGTSWITGTAC